MLRTEVSIALNDLTDPIEHAVHACHIRPADVHGGTIVHRSLDARAGRTPGYLYQIDLDVSDEAKYAKKLKQRARVVTHYHYHIPASGPVCLKHRPIVIGFGPAGMSAAVLLAEAGYRPLVLERGPAIKERRAAVKAYWNGGVLDPERNVQFGEGGAGAFSDGKLTTRVKDPRVQVILQALIKAGADPSIAWLNHPHIGTDVFGDLDEAIRRRIEALGGEVRFMTKVDDLIEERGILKGVRTSDGEEIPCEALILAVGHSARDTFHMLANKQSIVLQSKQFAVGVRVEHLQSFINARQYRNIPDCHALPAAEYHLSHTSSLHKGTYTFCMCPGGFVVPSASVPDTIVTNGMSYHARDGINANAAVLVQVDQRDYGDQLFDGVSYQEKLEKAAWTAGMKKAPAQTIASYLGSETNEITEVKPTYAIGVHLTDLHPLFSDSINQSLEEFFHYAEQVFPGFCQHGSLMTGVESRSSSPIRIVRDLSSLESGLSGLYPAGEGAGYSGGIVSSAIDGLKCAEKVVERWSPAA